MTTTNDHLGHDTSDQNPTMPSDPAPQPAARLVDGDQHGAFVYDAARRVWRYDASYDDRALAQRRATSLFVGTGLPFFVTRYGYANTVSLTVIPGFYAVTACDVRQTHVRKEREQPQP